MNIYKMNPGEPLPEDEYHSIKETYKLLCDLIDPKKYPRLPKKVRDHAKKCLRHYPIRRTVEDMNFTIDFFNPR